MVCKRGLYFFALLLITAGLNSGANPAPSANPSATNPAALARAVGTPFEVVGRSAAGSKGAPVLLLEERHDSRAAQIQHAITLLRLHDKHAVKDVVLEGYLKDGPPLQTDWVARVARTQDPVARARVFSRFLREGENQFGRIHHACIRRRPGASLRNTQPV